VSVSEERAGLIEAFHFRAADEFDVEIRKAQSLQRGKVVLAAIAVVNFSTRSRVGT
jgi:hypothetical protein